MEPLHHARCEACSVNSQRVTQAELKTLMSGIADWNIETRDDVMQLEKIFMFDNFSRALAFTNSIGRIAEEHGHHPCIITEWGKVTVIWWTHSIGGLHRNDFIMAAKTDCEFKAQKHSKR